MKKVLKVLFIVFFVLPGIALVIGVVFSDPPPKYSNHLTKYAKTSLNVRKYPKLDSEVLRILKPNEKVIVYDSVVKGFTLVLNKDSTKYGWTSKNYIQNIKLNKSQLQKIKQQQEETKKEQEEAKKELIKRKEEKKKNRIPSMLVSDAKYYAHEKVLKLLKSPSTADFGLWDEKAYKWNDGEYYGYTIKGYVDSQNGFGAILRTNYSVNIGKNRDGEIATSRPVFY
ncbi:MAG: hypothetical protein ACJA2M_000927 [Polaribacter sp.]|jgi:hypothetical protein